jgi:hypothetical protein
LATGTKASKGSIEIYLAARTRLVASSRPEWISAIVVLALATQIAFSGLHLLQW